ncbi:glycoside hydrolase family 92 protein [Photobacterium sp. NCIMB 13483]|uniref:GH92 family glycosyl hydrolase n=1 Tax=Photobacterium sp. NCIMB 13483 TaxID=2022103 RepID=UPI000D16BE59|nr:GH92 family glycosyl hydrolase [Photobacterium sp. NCIMB 13483]PST86485.1 glycoside hydrolase family 92 protein [Photobacterium sp. NCIMB 13483]
MFKLSIVAAAIALSVGLVGCNNDNSTQSSTDKNDNLPTLAVLNYVDPLIGTDGLGNVNPSPVTPEGMIQPSPDNWNPTNWEGKGSPSDYHHYLNQLSGFSTTHISGAGKGDLNDFAFLPYTGFHSTAVTMDKQTEISKVGYYAVDLIETKVKAELTATDRVAFQRYSFPAGADRKVKIDLQHELLEQYGNHSRSIYYKKVADNAIAGARTSNEWGQWQTVYFYAEFSEPFSGHMAYVEGKQTAATEVGLADYQGYGDKRDRVRDVVTYLNFGDGDQPITVKIAISGTSIDGAMANLQADDNGYDFDEVVADNQQQWAKVLNKFTIKGGTQADKTMFYTSLYRTYVAPFVYQDVDGKYRGMDGKVHQADADFTNYSVYSMWDTFRAAHPLKTIIDKERAIEYAHDLMNKFKTGGVLPKWELHSDYTGEMVGYPAVSVIADVMVKYPDAFTQQDFELALKAADVSANFDLTITQDWVPYKDAWNGDKRFTVMTRHGEYAEQHGYVPADAKKKPQDGGIAQDKYDELVNESVSYGLENAYYDWCIAQIAKLAGDDAQYQRYIARSQAYKPYFDLNKAEYAKYGATGFMRPKNHDGSWVNNYPSCAIDGQGDPITPLPEGCDINDAKSFDIFWPYRAEHRGQDFTEGNTWQWSWFAPHDIVGLKQTMGGEAGFLQNLDALFTANDKADTSQGDMTGYIGQFIMGNEPDHHVPYLYNWTAEPWKTQEYVDQAMKKFFHPTKAGLIGNEDVGQMSAWYIMGALGFYQVNPGAPIYTIGRPLFDEVKFDIDDGQFTITAENNSPDNIYVESVTINGKPLGNHYTFAHSEIMAGGELHFVMTNKKPTIK